MQFQNHMYGAAEAESNEYIFKSRPVFLRVLQLEPAAFLHVAQNLKE